MICAIVHQLTRNLTPEEIVASGFDKYYVDHTLALWPQSAGGIPFNACEFQSKGDPITDLTEDMAADAAASQEQPSHSFLRNQELPKNKQPLSHREIQPRSTTPQSRSC